MQRTFIFFSLFAQKGLSHRDLYGLTGEEHGGNASRGNDASTQIVADIHMTIAKTVTGIVYGEIDIAIDTDAQLETGETLGNETEELLGIDDAHHGVGLGTFEAFGGTSSRHDELLAVGGEGEGVVNHGVEDVGIGGKDVTEVHTILLLAALTALEGLAFAKGEGEADCLAVTTGYKDVATAEVVAGDHRKEVALGETQLEVVESSVLGIEYPELASPLGGFTDLDAAIGVEGVGEFGLGRELVGAGHIALLLEPLTLGGVGGNDDAVHDAAGVLLGVELTHDVGEACGAFGGFEVGIDNEAADEAYADGVSDEGHLVFLPLSGGEEVLAFDDGGGVGGVEDFVKVDVDFVVAHRGAAFVPQGAEVSFKIVCHDGGECVCFFLY